MGMTMCQGTDCPLRNDCYRYTAEPNPYRQSYFAETPLEKISFIGGPEQDWCDYFIKNEDEKK